MSGLVPEWKSGTTGIHDSTSGTSSRSGAGEMAPSRKCWQKCYGVAFAL
jgi:hypothetical protein